MNEWFINNTITGSITSISTVISKASAALALVFSLPDRHFSTRRGAIAPACLI